MDRPTIIGFGGAVLDEVHAIDGLPEPDSVLYIKDSYTNLGGMIGNSLVTAAKLGANAVCVGAVGDDYEGAVIREFLSSRGVDVQHLQQRTGGNSPKSIIFRVLENDTRNIFNRKGLLDLPGLSEIPLSCLKDASCLHLDGFWLESSIEMAIEAQRLNIPVTLDISQNMAADSLFRILERVDYFIPSIHAMRQITGKENVEEMADFMMDMGCSRIIITMGKEGAYCREKNDRGFTVPVYPMDVVDTNGLGDIFHGAIAYGVSQAWPMRKLVEFASATAAIACSRVHDGTSHLPSCAEVSALMERH